MSPSTCPTQALPETPWISLCFQDTCITCPVPGYVAASGLGDLEDSGGKLIFVEQFLPNISNFQQEKTALGPTLERL